MRLKYESVKFHAIQCAMPFGNMCAGQACTKACLATRITKYIEKEGYFPAIMSPCMHTQGAPYWMWTNRYQGDLVTVDVDAPAYPHLKTEWKVSSVFPDIKQSMVLITSSRNSPFTYQLTLLLRCQGGWTLEVTSLIWRWFNDPGAVRRKSNYLERSY